MVVPANVAAELHYLPAKLGRPTGTSALPVAGDLEMQQSSKVELTHRVVASSAVSSQKQTRCSGGSVPGAVN